MKTEDAMVRLEMTSKIFAKARNLSRLMMIDCLQNFPSAYRVRHQKPDAI